ncbi:MAG: TatD family deoxyribonuclease [Candidatus Staskawiczbacteria bacterium]|nr:TatD family deoxyribonuclease [Candidatus Staskawiczbacteria bacterium]
MIIDTHSHVNFNAFKDDADLVVKKTLSENIQIINVGTKYETSKSAVGMAEKYEQGVFASIGLHPMYSASEFIKIKTDPNEEEFLIQENEFDKEKYRDLAKSKKVLAIGEIGLDYYYKPKTALKLQQFKEKQKRIFNEQLDLAKELNLPVILHCRVAHDDVIEILKRRGEKRGVIHCFTGSLEQAKKYIEMGFYIGINGIIFKFNIDEVIKEVSLENILVETDCPYLTPPTAEEKRNQPIFIKHTIKKIAELKNVSFEKVCEKTTENAKNLFLI